VTRELRVLIETVRLLMEKIEEAEDTNYLKPELAFKRRNPEKKDKE